MLVLRQADNEMKLLIEVMNSLRMHWLAGREGRCVTGAKVPVAECGLRDGVDNIGELTIRYEWEISR